MNTGTNGPGHIPLRQNPSTHQATCRHPANHRFPTDGSGIWRKRDLTPVL